jgi:ubiquinone biosynthesis protein
LSRLFVGIVSEDSRQVVAAIAALGTIRQRGNLRRFEREIEQLLEQVLAMPLREMDIGALLAQIFQLAYRYKVLSPADLNTGRQGHADVFRALLDQLDPDLNLLTIMKPVADKLIWRAWSLDDLGRDLTRGILDTSDLLRQTPGFLLNFQHKLEDDDFTFQLGVRNLNKLQRQLDRITNRLSFSIILLAVA